LQRSLHVFDPVTGEGFAVITATIQPDLTQLSDDDVVKASRQDFVRLNSLSRSDADPARHEVPQD